MSAAIGEAVYDALVLVLPAHVVVHVRDLIDSAETVDDAIASVKRYIEDEIAAAVASGVWYADAWKSFGNAVELLLRTYGNYVVSLWLNDYVRYLLRYDPSRRIEHFIAITATIRDEVLMQMSAVADGDGNLQTLVTIERPICSALSQLIVLDDVEYAWLINRAVFYTRGDESRHFVYDVMRSAGCIKPITKLSEFMP